MSATVVKGLDENGRRISSMDFETMVQAAAENNNKNGGMRKARTAS